VRNFPPSCAAVLALREFESKGRGEEGGAGDSVGLVERNGMGGVEPLRRTGGWNGYGTGTREFAVCTVGVEWSGGSVG
jgi:hypothetical protein